MSEVERIAREAVALCADLLRRYTFKDGELMTRTPYIEQQQVKWWGERVLAWQDQLDQSPPPVPWWMDAPCPTCGAKVCDHARHPDMFKEGQSPSPVPRVWKKGDAPSASGLDTPMPRLLDRFDVEWVADRSLFWRGRSNRHDWCSWEALVERGPLTEVITDGSNPDGGADG